MIQMRIKVRVMWHFAGVHLLDAHDSIARETVFEMDVEQNTRQLAKDAEFAARNLIATDYEMVPDQDRNLPWISIDQLAYQRIDTESDIDIWFILSMMNPYELIQMYQSAFLKAVKQ